MVVWCCVFLGRRLYVLVFVAEVCRSMFFVPHSIFIVLLVCHARVVEVGVVSVGGFMVWATCWLFFAIFPFVRFCSRLWCVISVPPALYCLL